MKTILAILLTLAAAIMAENALAATNLSVSWTDNANNEDGFKIERCSGAVCINFTQVSTTATNITAVTDIGLAPGTYCYRVRAFNNAGDSAYSNTACGTVPQTIPGAPSAVTVTVVTVP